MKTPATDTPRLARTALALLVAATLAACGTPGPRSSIALDDARMSYERAARDPQVARSAELELRKAQQALQQGQTALQTDQDTAVVDHYAYLAKRRVEIAQQAAAIASAEQAVRNASETRNSIVIASRTAEAEAQRAQAEAARRQAGSASQRARSLEQQLAELKAKQTDRGMVLTLGDVLFDTGRAELKPGAMRTIDQLTTFLRENPERTVQIEGYTDSTGSSALNQTLSQNRAESVRNALLDRGIAMDRIAARGLGASSPVASNSTAAGRQRNRRVEVVISNESKR